LRRAGLGRDPGGAFNPAVALALCIAGGFPWDHLWIYLLAGALGGCAAAGTAAFLLFDDDAHGA
jgi:glycerol uptake facilitator-like aquaporin